MSIADILIHVEDRDSVDSVLRLSIAIAKKMDARLTALFIIPPFILPAYVSYEMPAEVYQSQSKLAEKEAELVRSKVDSVAGELGVEIAFETARGDYVHTISRYARFTDLLVLKKDAKDVPTVSPQEVILDSHRLSLVVPSGMRLSEFPQRALVAFNGSRESVQTLHDAMPVLKLCEKVILASFDEKKADSAKYRFDMEKLIAYLSHHGIEAETITDTVKSHAVGESLLNHVKDTDTDLIVMGCYGHSRFREWVLGGATSEILEHLSIPVLMSH